MIPWLFHLSLFYFPFLHMFICRRNYSSQLIFYLLNIPDHIGVSLVSKNNFCLSHSHKSRVKGHLRLKMTYLPKNPGPEGETADQTEEPDVSFANVCSATSPCISSDHRSYHKSIIILVFYLYPKIEMKM